MISITQLTAIRDALVPLTDRVYHYWRPKMAAPYIIWAELSEGQPFYANNKKAESFWHGTVDLYTKEEFDPLFDQIQEALQGVEGLTYTLTDVQYEDDTGLIHHTWEWSLT